jgi:hypothetical protein
MSQLQLPIFQAGTVPITSDLGYIQQNGQVVYLHGMMPVFTHEVSDTAAFKMIVSQFYINGVAQQVQIVNAFGINPLALKRWVKKYKQEGAKAFFVEKRGRAKGKKKAGKA